MERLTERWYAGGRSGACLQPLAWGYGAVVRARRRAYEQGWLASRTAGKPVIVVGNLTVGGTGKTPLVLWLAEQLKGRGLAVGVVSRGYGRSSTGPRRVHAGSRWEEVGDEPLLIHRRTGCPMMVAEDRLIAARRLAAEGADVILADDGLQHLRLARDCEIVVIDAARGFGNGRLLPAGPLREPASRALGVDFVVVNGGDGASLGELLRGRAGPVAAMHLEMGEARRLDGAAPPRPLERFAPGPVHAVAGIGHPGRFFGELRRRGLRIIEHAYPDHHPFARADLEFADDLPILMTEKDAVRCASLATPRQWYVPVEARLDGADAMALLDLIGARIRDHAARRSGASAALKR